MVRSRQFLPIFLPFTLTDTVSGQTTPEALAIELININRDFPKSEKEIPKFVLITRLNIVGKKLNKKLSSIMGSGITLQK